MEAAGRIRGTKGKRYNPTQKHDSLTRWDRRLARKSNNMLSFLRY
jgi:hypothetical protein